MGGMPLMVVARNLGHADTRMVERHYGHLAPSYVAESVRKHAPKFRQDVLQCEGAVMGTVVEHLLEQWLEALQAAEPPTK